MTLYVVATPIGNLGDMVPRAIEVLQSVDVIAAEDTRHSKRLMSHFGINTPMVAYHDHSDEKAIEAIVRRLNSGESVALISDAGTPLVSDPGYQLVDLAHHNDIAVVPIPGCCAAIAALSASGLPSDRFSFEGFLPAKQQSRLNKLSALKDQSQTLIFYEAPHRLLATLEDMSATFGGGRLAVLGRELTKNFETIKRLPIAELVEFVKADSNQQRGESVLLVAGAPKATGLDLNSQRVMDILAEELPVKQASALAAKITGVKKNQLYQYQLDKDK